jgi:hypothetical protein
LSKIADYINRLTAIGAGPRTTRDVIVWWEKRRLAFNFVVGVSGLVSLAIAVTFLALPPHVSVTSFWGYPIPASGVFAAAVFFGIVANLCYTLGWATELGLRKFSPAAASRLASLVIKVGFTFSVLVCFSYAGICAAHWVFRVVAAGGFTSHALDRAAVIGSYTLRPADSDSIELRNDGSYLHKSVGSDGRNTTNAGLWKYFDTGCGYGEVEVLNFTSTPEGRVGAHVIDGCGSLKSGPAYSGGVLVVEHVGRVKHLVFYDPDMDPIYYAND